MAKHITDRLGARQNQALLRRLQRRHEQVEACLSVSLPVLLACGALWSSSARVAHAEVALPAGTLPQPSAAFVSSGSASSTIVGSTLTIDQTSNKAILNWDSFNVAGDSAVRFNQPGADAAALNRIHSADPSVIQGSIDANGQIYLINQNGILFDQGAQVNVNSLVASSLEIDDEFFEKGLLSNTDGAVALQWQGDQAGFEQSQVRVENGASITAQTGGSVLLFAPTVSNNGKITSPEGQTVLAAGAKVYLAASDDPKLRGFVVEVDPFTDSADSQVKIGGSVTNERLGEIVTARGNASLVGYAVNQSGLVRATTSVQRNGSILLLARDTLTAAVPGQALSTRRAQRTGELVLGEGSRTEILPETADTQTIRDDQLSNYIPSTVELMGHTIHVQKDAQIIAPGGKVTLAAQQTGLYQDAVVPAEGVRVYLESGSRIDVSGVEDVAVPVERNIIKVELRGNELKDAPLLRDSPLRNKTVYVDANNITPSGARGTDLADVSGYLGQIPRTAAELAAGGGTVSIISEGDAILRAGSTLDVSGGSAQYQGGQVHTSQLVGEDGRVYNIGDATADRVYTGIAGTFTTSYAKWGVVNTYQQPGSLRYMPGYLEGKTAGTVKIVAHGLALDSELIGHTVTGPYQRTPETTPSGGQLVLGDAGQLDESAPNFKLPDVLFELQKTLLQDSFTFFSTDVPDFVSLTTAYLDQGGFTRTAIYSDGKIVVPEGVAITTATGGAVALTGRQIDVAGDIRAPGGSIALTTRRVTGTVDNRDDYGIQVAAGSTLDARGGWVNEAPWMNLTPGTEPLFIAGGTISIDSAWDVMLAEGSVIDVSGGGWLRPEGARIDGDAGDIRIATGRLDLSSTDAQDSRLELGAELRGHALGEGGTLSVSASKVRIGATPDDDARTLWLTPEFFNAGGFSSYSIKGQDGLTVAAGTEVQPVQTSMMPLPSLPTRPTGTDLFELAVPTVLPVEQRAAVSLALSTGSSSFGDIVVEQGAALRVDPTGRIELASGRGISVFGTLDAPAGVISLGNQPPSQDIGFEGEVSIWLGDASQLLATGASRVIADDFGERSGEVYDGGEISINAAKGALVVEQGALLDVSGTQVELDLRQVGSSDTTARPTQVASDAGSIALAAREGMLLDGELRGQAGGTGAAGGMLSVAIEGDPIPFFPAAPRTLIVRESGTSVPEGLEPGMEIDPNAFDPEASTLNGRAFLSAAQVRAGGFESLALTARDAIEFHGDVALQLSRNLSLDAPIIGAPDGARVSLDAAYLALGNTSPDLQAPRSATGGEGTLDAQARLIELIGNTALQGFGNASFESQGDLRLRGVYNVATMKSLDGALTAAGDLHFMADQIYPATMSRFTLEVLDKPDGRIVFEGGSGGGPVLSAAGELTVRAPFIEQRGVLKAPFGTISLEASDTLTLAAGSITSVSGEAQLIPFGRTDLGGRDYIYDLGINNLIITTPPEKQINLTGATVDFAPDAVVDLSGGGDLYAYEFIPGPGGSRDVLDTADSYAILPSLSAEFAPFDPQYNQNVADLTPGDSVYLSGVPGLIDGYYPLLPAHYALLPGAFLVTPRDGYTDLAAGVASVLPNGGYLVGGQIAHLTADGSMVSAARSSGFEVLSGTAARLYTEFLETKAGTFFAAQSGVQLPGDAGRLSFSASELLTLDGIVQSNFASAYRGAEVDISAPRLAVVSPGTNFTDDGFLVLEADRLNALNAASLLLGGTRSGGSDAVVVTVSSEQVVIANDGAHALSAPELLLAAQDRVELHEGAVVTGTGTVSGTAKDIRVGFAIRDTDGNGLINETDENRGDVDGDGYITADDNIDGNGALLRVSAGAPAAILREHVDRSRGTLSIAAGAEVRAAGAIALDATRDNTSQGTLVLGTGGALSLAAGRISLGDTREVVEGLKFSNAQLGALGDPASLTLHSYSTLDFYGAVALGDAALTQLNLQAAGIVGYANAAQAATLAADTVTLANIDGTAPGSAPVLDDGSAPVPGTGALEISARRIISDAGGDSLSIQGFATSTLRAEREIIAQGAGGLRTEGDLALRAPRITATAGADQDFIASGVLATLAMARPADLAAAELGGSLRLEGSRVDHAGNIELPAGWISLIATGDASDAAVKIAAGARIDATGRSVAFADTVASAPGGSVVLESAHGDVRIETDAQVDVSGAAGGAAGSLSIRAVNGTVQLGGTLKGGAAALANAVAPRQGSFLLDVGYLNDFSLLNAALNPAYAVDGNLIAGGFSAERDLRVRAGDVVIATADSVQAQRFQLAVDHGDIDVYGSIVADGPKGGDIALLAGSVDGVDGGRVTLHADSRLSAGADGTASQAGGSAGRGGKVLLATNSANGDIELQDGATIDVSGITSDRGGSVQLRAPRIGADSDVAVSALNATITGASRVTVEAVKVYSGISSVGTTTGSGKLNISTVATDNNAFMLNADAITARLGMADDAAFQLCTGVEVRSSGNLTLANDWNLATYRAGDEPGVLTLRAAGDLFLNANLSDGFSTALSTGTLSAGESWSYRLVGGADLTAASPLTVAATTALAPEQGDVVLATGKLVRTGTGAIDVAAGRNVELMSNASVIYTAGQPGAALDDFFVPSVNAVRAVFPTSGGDLRIVAQGDITAAPSTQLINDWQYRQGRLNSDGTLMLRENPAWWPRFNDFKQGVGALGGGDVSVRAGGDIANLSVVIPTNGRLPGAANTVPEAAALSVQGGGDLDVRAQGDINSALFYVGEGTGNIVAGGSLGSSRTGTDGGPLYSLFALGDGSYRVVAGGTVGVETVFNPTVIPQATGNTQGSGLTNKKGYFFTYGEDSGVSFTAITGSVLLKNQTNLAATHPLTSNRSNTELLSLALYPASLRAVALSGNVSTVGNMALFPALSGNLELLAQESVLIQGAINVSDADPARLPQPWSPGSVYVQAIDKPITAYSEAGPDAHSDFILHANDTQPVRVVALTGNVEGSTQQWILPKRAVVQAGQDIRNPYVIGQNLTAADVTRFTAGGDIVFDTLRDEFGNQIGNDSRITLGGPGRLEIQAGGDVDLGNSVGIQTIGNLNNPYLQAQGAHIAVQAGVGAALDYGAFLDKYIAPGASAARSYVPEMVAYLSALEDGATVNVEAAVQRFMDLPLEQQIPLLRHVLFTELKETGRSAVDALSEDYGSYERGYQAIATLFPGSGAAENDPYAGDVNLFFSQIKTQQGGDIELLVPGGLINAGLANSGSLSKTAAELGIVTLQNGNVRALVRDDFLVNQSRVFTLAGGDILLWSSTGNIDAGKGAKTASAAPPPRLIVTPDGKFALDVSQSIAGSGIGVLLTRSGIEAGDVDLIAPEGEVNAGDAGIFAAGNLNIAALRVVGADNIQVGGASLGLAFTDTGGIGVSMSGVSGLGEAGSAVDSATRSIGGADGANPFQGGQAMLTVSVIGFGD